MTRIDAGAETDLSRLRISPRGCTTSSASSSCRDAWRRERGWSRRSRPQRLGVSRTPVRVRPASPPAGGLRRRARRGRRAHTSRGRTDDQRRRRPISSTSSASSRGWPVTTRRTWSRSSGRCLPTSSRSSTVRCWPESHARPPDAYRAFQLDASFHRRYVVEAAPPRLLALHDAIKPQAERYARLYVTALTNELDVSVAEHERHRPRHPRRRRGLQPSGRFRPTGETPPDGSGR